MTNPVRLNSVLSLGLTLLLAACGQKPPAPAPAASSSAPAGQPAALDTDAEKVVNVYNWSDYIDPDVIESFQIGRAHV